GPNTVNAVFGATRNPWNLALTAGGSSGGSAAALATGMCPLAEGAELGGSPRGPASDCGVVGFRTTHGLIPRYPSGLAWDTYSVEGPMARTIADTALMLSVMAGADDRSPISYEVDPRELVQATKMPSVKGWRVAWTSDLGGLMPLDDAGRGELLRTRQWQRVREFLETRDLLITPTSATPPFPIGEPHPVEINGRPVGRMLQRSYLTYAFSVLGLPAISIPCGFTRQGLPVGLQ